MAASIFQFVKVANSLGTTLGTISAEHELEDSNPLRRLGPDTRSEQNNGAVDESEALRADSQVQLLRLRVKHREIIIFPDQRYLSCVVQRVGKQSGADGR